MDQHVLHVIHLVMWRLIPSVHSFNSFSAHMQVNVASGEDFVRNLGIGFDFFTIHDVSFFTFNVCQGSGSLNSKKRIMMRTLLSEPRISVSPLLSLQQVSVAVRSRLLIFTLQSGCGRMEWRRCVHRLLVRQEFRRRPCKPRAYYCAHTTVQLYLKRKKPQYERNHYVSRSSALINSRSGIE